MTTGDRFGRLVVVERSGSGASGASRWLCRCDCGNEFTARQDNLKAGRTKSCGCLRRETAGVTGRRNVRHGQSWGAAQTPEYRAWHSAIDRTTRPGNDAWRHYGGRGIRMCQEWLDSFEAFLRDVGPRPGPGYSIDRIDVNGDYEPGNVRWATRSQQERNKRVVPARTTSGAPPTIG